MDQEFRRIVPAADTAVLFIHGIVGTPRHFDDLITLLPLPHSGHYYYPPADKEALHEAFTAFLTP